MKRRAGKNVLIAAAAAAKAQLHVQRPRPPWAWGLTQKGLEIEAPGPVHVHTLTHAAKRLLSATRSVFALTLPSLPPAAAFCDRMQS